MKKLTAILFIIIFTLSQWGYYCFYAYKIYTAKQFFKAQLLKQIPPEFITKILLNKNVPLNWCEGDRELQIGNKMYDVVKSETKNKDTYLYCIADTKEDDILQKLSNICKSNNNKNDNNKPIGLIKLQLNDIICTNFFQSLKNKINITTLLFYESCPNLIYRTVPVITPPPDAIA